MCRTLNLTPCLAIFLLTEPGCDSRPVNLDPDGGVSLTDSLRPGTDSDPSADQAIRDSRPNGKRCVVATRILSCNFEFVAATVEEVLADPCLSSAEVPHDTLQECPVLPFPCTAVPPSRPPSYLVGPSPDDKGCVFIHECTSVADCVIAEDCRDPGRCCGCGDPFPLSLVEQEPCLFGPNEPFKKPGPPAPPDACGSRCPDYCGGADSDWAPVPPLELACVPNPVHSALNICAMAPPWTPCGELVCNRATEICVTNSGGGDNYFTCQPILQTCQSDRRCACLGAQVCQGVFSTCFDQPAENTVACECLNC